MFGNNPLVKGILIGVGAVSSVSRVQAQRREGGQFPSPPRRKGQVPAAGFETMSVEDLMRTKETIEDLIAEKELQDQSVTVEATSEEA